MAFAVAGVALSRGAEDRGGKVDIVARAAEHRVDVLIDGKPFTTYRYGIASVKKPVLFPLRSARGTTVTRGYPLEPRPGERADHPHHVGHWFNHGEVNGFDFWGHSDETPASLRSKVGSIVHTGVVRAASGIGQGTLVVTADWVAADGSRLLAETTELVFRGGADWRAIDRLTTWQAVAGPVVFGDTKEGSFGIRVARTLEHPSDAPARFVDRAGRPETAPRVDTSPVTGQYLASDGRTGEAVWGSRGPWMALTGTVDGEALTIAILDHPKNPGSPVHWHARGYGLFAANPFGSEGFDPKQPKSPTTLPAGGSFTFRHRILIRGGKASREELLKEYERFLAAQS
jgi:hypothetical protein